MSWLPKKKVLVPVDFSEPSLEALALAKELVASERGLHVAHVLEFTPDYDANVFAGESLHAERKKKALEKLKEVTEEHGLSDCEAVILDDYRQRGPGVTLAQYAQDVGAELIVIPTHGYTGLRRLLMGSVAEQVLRHAPCPVLLLPQRGG